MYFGWSTLWQMHITSQRRVFLPDQDKLPAWNWTSARKKKKTMMNVTTSGCFFLWVFIFENGLIVFLALCGSWTEIEGTLKKRVYASFIERLKLHSEWKDKSNYISSVKNEVKKKNNKKAARITHLNFNPQFRYITFMCQHHTYKSNQFPQKLWNQFLSVEYEVHRDNFSVP